MGDPAPDSQASPADDLIHGACGAGLGQAGGQGQKGAGGWVPAPRRLRGAGQRGGALLQCPAWAGLAGGASAGARPLGRILVWVPREQGAPGTSHAGIYGASAMKYQGYSNTIQQT